MTSEEILDAFAFYTTAPEAERRAIRDAAVAVHLAEGASFQSEGEVCEAFGLVGRGDIRVFKRASNGRELTLYHVADRQVCLVNLLSVYLGRPAMASGVVEAPTDAVVIGADVFRKVLTRNEALMEFVLETMASRLVAVMTLVEEITVRRMDARIASWLLRKFASQPAEAIALTHDELAAEIGTVREVVSRVLKEFERRGAIRLLRARIVLLDAHVLSTVVSGRDAG